MNNRQSLTYENALKLHSEFMDLIGTPLSKDFPNYLIEKFSIEYYGNNKFVVYVHGYNKFKHIGVYKQLIDYITEYHPDFDFELYGVKPQNTTKE